MPNNFTLTRKSDLKAGPVLFVEIDDELRKHFKEPPDPDRYLGGWYAAIGQHVAFGKSFAEVREDFQRAIRESPIEDHQDYYRGLILILDYLDQHYTPNAWATIGKLNPRRTTMAGRPLRQARLNSSEHNGSPQQYTQTDITLTARQVLNLRLLVRQQQAEMQYLDLTAQQKSLISSWLDQILGAVLSPHTLD